MNQRQQVLEYVRKHGSITGKDAVTELGIMKLSNRICELEQDGYNFDRKTETKANRFGKRVSYTRYYIQE